MTDYSTLAWVIITAGVFLSLGHALGYQRAMSLARRSITHPSTTQKDTDAS